ncbi:MAG: DNA repair and recombination protein RadB [Methanomicrobiales archaeon]|nr:DNA repair and recombination protein RadB [Methanomicrobiales archaeon]
MTEGRVSTGISELDALLGGGLERRVITQIYGDPGCGKSTLCQIAAVAVLRAGHSVVYFDPEGFSVERFRQVAGADAEKLAERLFLYEPLDFDQQGLLLSESEKVLKRGKTGLLVMDSATVLYRAELSSGKEAQRKLARQVILLLGLSRRYDLPVLITNQVYMDVVRNVSAPLGGTILSHLSKAIVRIEVHEGFRRAVLEKHRSLPAGGFFDFEITGNGIRAVSSP